MIRMNHLLLIMLATVTIFCGLFCSSAGAQEATVPVTVATFARAESDIYFGRIVKSGGFGKLHHRRAPTSIDKQDVIRMNRDTLYSSGVFDLDAGAVSITLPDAGKRFMSLQIITEDHYALPVVYAPGAYTFTKKQIETRYMMAVVRTLIDADKSEDVKAANAKQDEIKVQQAAVGTFDVPNWDPTSQKQIRDALQILGANTGTDPAKRFGMKDEVDRLDHLIGTAVGWGANPPDAATYASVNPVKNDGKTVYAVTVKDVPVDGFWSITVYNKDGYLEKNDLGVYSVNNVNGTPNPDGSLTVQFGGDPKAGTNVLSITPGWNYTVRLYRPRKDILDGRWKFPTAEPLEK